LWYYQIPVIRESSKFFSFWQLASLNSFSHPEAGFECNVSQIPQSRDYALVTTITNQIKLKCSKQLRGFRDVVSRSRIASILNDCCCLPQGTTVLYLPNCGKLICYSHQMLYSRLNLTSILCLSAHDVPRYFAGCRILSSGG
jgi:hypothetical protein